MVVEIFYYKSAKNVNLLLALEDKFEYVAFLLAF